MRETPGNATSILQISDDMKPRKLASLGFFVLHLLGMKQMGETWFRNFLFDPQLHQLLEKVDADLAEEARRVGCDCGGKLIEPIMSARRVEFRNGTNAIAFVAIKKIAGAGGPGVGALPG